MCEGHWGGGRICCIRSICVCVLVGREWGLPLCGELGGVQRVEVGGEGLVEIEVERSDTPEGWLHTVAGGELVFESFRGRSVSTAPELRVESHEEVPSAEMQSPHSEKNFQGLHLNMVDQKLENIAGNMLPKLPENFAEQSVWNTPHKTILVETVEEVGRRTPPLQY